MTLAMALDEKEAAKRVVQLRREIEEHNRRYYEEAAPTISDRQYDALYRELGDLEKRFPKLATPDSPTQRVGWIVETARPGDCRKAPARPRLLRHRPDRRSHARQALRAFRVAEKTWFTRKREMVVGGFRGGSFESDP